MPISSRAMKWIRESCDNLGCTRMGIEASGKSKCIGYHCAFCGEPCSSVGHNCEPRKTEIITIVDEEETLELKE